MPGIIRGEALVDQLQGNGDEKKGVVFRLDPGGGVGHGCLAPGGCGDAGDQGGEEIGPGLSLFGIEVGAFLAFEAVQQGIEDDATAGGQCPGAATATGGGGTGAAEHGMQGGVGRAAFAAELIRQLLELLRAQGLQGVNRSGLQELGAAAGDVACCRCGDGGEQDSAAATWRPEGVFLEGLGGLVDDGRVTLALRFLHLPVDGLLSGGALLGTVAEEGAALAAEGSDDLESGADLLLVEDRRQAVLGVAGVALEAGQGLLCRLAGLLLLSSLIGDVDLPTADGALGGAFGFAFGLHRHRGGGAEAVEAGQGAVGGLSCAGGGLALAVGADALAAAAVAEAEAGAVGLILGLVLDIAGGEGGGGEAVAVVLYGGIAAGDDRALEIGVSAHVDLKALIARLQAGLLGNAGIGAVDLGLAGIEAGAEARAGGEGDAETAAEVLFPAVVAALVLQALEVEITADGCGDLFGACHGTL